MPLHCELDHKLRKVFALSTTIDGVFKAYDIAFVTNKHGELVTLFFGKRRPDGHIARERFTRTIKRQPGSLAVKPSPWDNHGKIGR